MLRIRCVWVLPYFYIEIKVCEGIELLLFFFFLIWMNCTCVLCTFFSIQTICYEVKYGTGMQCIFVIIFAIKEEFCLLLKLEVYHLGVTSLHGCKGKKREKINMKNTFLMSKYNTRRDGCHNYHGQII